ANPETAGQRIQSPRPDLVPGGGRRPWAQAARGACACTGGQVRPSAASRPQVASNKSEKRLNLLIATSSRLILRFGHALPGQVGVDYLRGRKRAAGAGDVRPDAGGGEGRAVDPRHGRQEDRPEPAALPYRRRAR